MSMLRQDKSGMKSNQDLRMFYAKKLTNIKGSFRKWLSFVTHLILDNTCALHFVLHHKIYYIYI